MNSIEKFKETEKSSELIFDGTVLHLYRDEIYLPDGREAFREYCRHIGAVCVVPITDEGEVICVSQYRYPLADVVLEIPAGKLDAKNEEPMKAAIRELREETGATCKKLTYMGKYFSSPAILDECIYMFMAEGLEFGDTDFDDDEFIESRRIPLDELVGMIMRGEVIDGKTQAAVMRAAYARAHKEQKPVAQCFKKADILLPDFERTDAYRWAVIACDQFTSEPEYWQAVSAEATEYPSTLNTILPELYLSEAAERVPKVNSCMKNYLDDVLVSHPDSAIFVERTQSDGSIRRGIVMAVDLECYNFSKGAQSLIRATEATVLERIPPRVAIRRDAPIELPHVMLLIDDPKCTVIEPLIDSCDGAIAYDTPLMLGGGHIRGRFLSEQNYEAASNALLALITPEQMKKRYGDSALAPLLFAVGDGNHSLATAKTAYEEIKAKFGESAALSHPARYALAEIVNIHDSALKFEPIYRVMFGVNPHDVINELEKYASSLNGSAEAQKIEYIHQGGNGMINIPHPLRQLIVGTLGDFIDTYIAEHSGASVDYIHGVQSVNTLSSSDSCIGFIFDGMGKSELFKTVIFDGSLPRKTFSMGDARDKRYYMEARRITEDI